jgi:opacity protein-like surface antigen
MRSFRRAILGVLMLAGTCAPARADITAFLGATTTPVNRQVRGAAVGSGLLIVGFEFEYSSTAEDRAAGAPSLQVGSANGLLQTPVAILRFQPYVTAGAGIFRERFGTSTETGVAPNVGAGVKLSLAGPLRLRVDYRVFRLGDGARYTPSHRLYAGLNLKF